MVVKFVDAPSHMALKGCELKRMSSLQGKYRIESLCVDQWIVVLPPAIYHFVVFTFPDVIRYNLDSFFSAASSWSFENVNCA